MRKLFYSNNSDGSVVVHWDPAYRVPGYNPVYIVTFNNIEQRKKDRELRFHPTNETKTFDIKVSIRSLLNCMARFRAYA